MPVTKSYFTMNIYLTTYIISFSRGRVSLVIMRLTRAILYSIALKSSTQDHIWSQKEGVSGTKHFYWVILCFISQLFKCFYIREITTKASNVLHI